MNPDYILLFIVRQSTDDGSCVVRNVRLFFTVDVDIHAKCIGFHRAKGDLLSRLWHGYE